jgi:glycerol kinase
MLPEVKDNVDDYGVATALSSDLPICGVAGDQHAALIGQACFETGMMKSTYGTGCFALMNIGYDFKVSENRLLTTVAYRINGKITYALEGSIFVAGAAIQWLRDNLELFSDAKESEELALSVKDSNGVTFVPAFTGLGAPYWNPNARAAILGLTRESNKAHITRAALEAQAFQTHDLMDAMRKDSGLESHVIRVDGGLVNNKFVCQFLADILNVTIDVPEVVETTALGAAYLAGIGMGIYQGFDDVSKRWKLDHAFAPQMDENTRQGLLSGWQNAVSCVNR